MEMRFLLKLFFLLSGFLFIFPAGMSAFWKLLFSLTYKLYTKISKQVFIKKFFYLFLSVYLYTHEFFHYVMALFFGYSPELRVDVEKFRGEVLYYSPFTFSVRKLFNIFVISTAPFLIPLFFDLCVVTVLYHLTSDFAKFFTCYFVWLFLTSYFRLPSEEDLKVVLKQIKLFKLNFPLRN